MTIKVLEGEPSIVPSVRATVANGATGAEIARLLGVSEGAVRYHVRRMNAGAVDGRSAQAQRAAAYGDAIEHWRQSTENAGLNLAALHAWLVREHGYDASLRSVQRFWKRTYPAPRIRARRRVESSPRIAATGPRPVADAGRPGSDRLGVRGGARTSGAAGPRSLV